MGMLSTIVTTRQPLRTQLPRSRQQRCVALLLDLGTAARSVKRLRCYLAGGLGRAAHSDEEVGSFLVGQEEQEAGLSSSGQRLQSQAGWSSMGPMPVTVLDVVLRHCGPSKMAHSFCPDAEALLSCCIHTGGSSQDLEDALPELLKGVKDCMEASQEGMMRSVMNIVQQGLKESPENRLPGD